MNYGLVTRYDENDEYFDDRRRILCRNAHRFDVFRKKFLVKNELWSSNGNVSNISTIEEFYDGSSDVLRVNSLS